MAAVVVSVRQSSFGLFEEHATTADFLFQNIDAHDMCAFTKASLRSPVLDAASDGLYGDRIHEYVDARTEVVPSASPTSAGAAEASGAAIAFRQRLDLDQLDPRDRLDHELRHPITALDGHR